MSLESVGERLKRIRQEKGLSLDDVRKKTKIHMNILKAIEGDSLTDLNPVYLKGFLKIYCKFLGIDPKECIPDYKEQASPSLNTVGPDDENRGLKAPSFLENVSLKLGSLRPDKRLKNVIISILLIIVLGIVLLSFLRFIATRPATERAQGKLKVKTQALAPRPQAAAMKVPREPGGTISLVISAKENCLVFVKVDGRVVLHRVLEKGRSDSWKAKEKIELSLGNAAAVELIVNGQRFTNLGRKGQQLKGITITEKEGLKIPR